MEMLLKNTYLLTVKMVDKIVKVEQFEKDL